MLPGCEKKPSSLFMTLLFGDNPVKKLCHSITMSSWVPCKSLIKIFCKCKSAGGSLKKLEVDVQKRVATLYKVKLRCSQSLQPKCKFTRVGTVLAFKWRTQCSTNILQTEFLMVRKMRNQIRFNQSIFEATTYQTFLSKRSTCHSIEAAIRQTNVCFNITPLLPKSLKCVCSTFPHISHSPPVHVSKSTPPCPSSL